MDDASRVTMTTTTNIFPLDVDERTLLTKNQDFEEEEESETLSASTSSSDLLSSFGIFDGPLGISSSKLGLSKCDILNGSSTESLFTGERTPPYCKTPRNSPSTPPSEVPVASLINFSDDRTIVTDSCSGVTLPEASVTWAPMIGGSTCTHARVPGQPYQWAEAVVGGGAEGGGGVESASRKSTEAVDSKRGNHFSDVSLVSTLAPLPLVSATSATSEHLPVPFDFPFSSVTSKPQVKSTTKVKNEPTPTGDCYSCNSSIKNDKGANAKFLLTKEKEEEKVRKSSNQCQYGLCPSKGAMCKDNKDNLDIPGGVCCPAGRPTKVMPNTPRTTNNNNNVVCSRECDLNFKRLSKELLETKDNLYSLTVQVEEQSSHISKLMEENRRYIQENGRLKKGRSRGGIAANNNNSSDSSYDLYCGDVYTGHHDVTAELEDRVMALQLQNSELSLCLERERRKRREAEERRERDEGYIKRLEDSVQTLRGTRVVMDPSTYRQVAEAYMAAKRTPARKPHAHHGGFTGSDLVCDAPTNNIMSSRLRQTHPPLHQTSSCPSSPNSVCFSPPTSRRLYPTIEYPKYQMYPEDFTTGSSSSSSKNNNNNNKGKKDRVASQDQGCSRGLGVSGNTMTPWDYQQLLSSLEDLDGASRGALS